MKLGHESNEASCDIVCLKSKDYIDIFYTTLAEYPGLLLAVISVDLIGRKLSMIIYFIIIGAFIFLLNLCVSR